MNHYYELRHTPQYPATSIASDVARHLEVRQYLGTALIVCKSPTNTMSVVRKQWLNLMRNIHKQRASTLNAEEILRLTHAILHMQKMTFVAKPPQETTAASIYFITPGELNILPPDCYTIYLLDKVKPSSLKFALGGLSNNGLVVNYDVGMAMSDFQLKPKSKLESEVLREWSSVLQLLKRFKITPSQLVNSSPVFLAANDHALDTLLGSPQEFLHITSAFQHMAHLGQPFTTISSTQQREFTAVARLAHRVQSLTPSTFSNYLIRNFGSTSDYEVFFLHDILANTQESKNFTIN
ncbi:MAG TPA: hypothetical protein VLA77_04610 [Candidatus Saccharimonadales bacterium]|nr:hypothetical protein [Candidatus Saccharimonadales bacterium]